MRLNRPDMWPRRRGRGSCSWQIDRLDPMDPAAGGMSRLRAQVMDGVWTGTSFGFCLAASPGLDSEVEGLLATDIRSTSSA